MGLDQRARQQMQIAAMRANYESRVGPIHDFGIHAAGCPACGFDQQKIIYCEGSSKLLDQPPDACPIGGEHLHVVCARCQWEHLTRLRNDPANPLLDENSGSLMVGYANAVLATILKTLDGTASVVGLLFDESEVKSHQAAATRVFVKRTPLEGGALLRFSLAPPEKEPEPAAQ